MKKVLICEEGEFDLNNIVIFRFLKRKKSKITPYHFEGSLTFRRIDSEDWIKAHPNAYVEYLFKDQGEFVECHKVRKQVFFPEYFNMYFKRDDPDLIAVVEEFGLEKSPRKAYNPSNPNNPYDACKLRIVEIPDDVDFYVSKNNRYYEHKCETIHEIHRIWPDNREFHNCEYDEHWRVK